MALLVALVRVSGGELCPAVNGPGRVPDIDAPLIPYSTELTCAPLAAPGVKLNWIVLAAPVAVAVTPVGASGGATARMAGADSAGWVESPALLVAVTAYS